MKSKKLPLMFGIFAIVAIAFAIGSYFYGSQAHQEASQKASAGMDRMERDYSPSLGLEDAPVTLVEFLDPECESCRAFYPYVKEILSAYPEELRLVVRYVPFHGNSEFVIRILEASRKQNQYWQTLDLLFQTQPQWGDHHNPQPEKIWEFLTALNLDLDRLKDDMKDPNIDRIIAQDKEDAAALEVRYTPTFFVNGKPLPEFGLEQLVSLIREEVKKSQDWE